MSTPDQLIETGRQRLTDVAQTLASLDEWGRVFDRRLAIGTFNAPAIPADATPEEEAALQARATELAILANIGSLMLGLNNALQGEITDAQRNIIHENRTDI